MKSIVIILLCIVIIGAHRKLVPFIYVERSKKYSTEQRLINLMSSQIRSYKPWNKYVVKRLNKEQLIDIFMSKITTDILNQEYRVVNQEFEYSYRNESIPRIEMYNQLYRNINYLNLSKEQKLQALNLLFYNNQYYWEYTDDKYIFLTEFIHTSLQQTFDHEFEEYQTVMKPKLVGDLNA